MAYAAHLVLLAAPLRTLVLFFLRRLDLIVHGSYCCHVALLHAWRFCPRCGAKLEVGGGRARCSACGFVAYASSAPTANALVTAEDGRALLARRSRDPDKGLWDIPGGFLEEGEHPFDGLRRELREETGLEVEPLDFLCATVDRYGEGPEAHATLNLTWTARVLGGVSRPADDVAELRWFAPDELPPEDQLAFTSVKDVLAAWLERGTERGEP